MKLILSFAGVMIFGLAVVLNSGWADPVAAESGERIQLRKKLEASFQSRNLEIVKIQEEISPGLYGTEPRPPIKHELRRTLSQVVVSSSDDDIDLAIGFGVSALQEVPGNWDDVMLALNVLGHSQLDSRVKEFALNILDSPWVSPLDSMQNAVIMGALGLLGQQWSSESENRLVSIVKTGVPSTVTSANRLSPDERIEISSSAGLALLSHAPVESLASITEALTQEAGEDPVVDVSRWLGAAKRLEAGDPDPFEGER